MPDSPLTRVHIKGTASGNVEVLTGTQKNVLAPGNSHVYHHPNGTEVRYSNRTTDRTYRLGIHVIRGLLFTTEESTPNMGIHSPNKSEAELVWGVSKGPLEFHNKSTNSPIYVGGASQRLILISPNSTIRTESGGDESLLAQLITGTAFASPSQPGMPPETIQQTQSRISVLRSSVDPKMSPILILPEENGGIAFRFRDLQVYSHQDAIRTQGVIRKDGIELYSFQQGFRWNVRATGRSVYVHCSVCPGLEINVTQGESATFQLDPKLRLLKIVSGPSAISDEVEAIQMLLPDGSNVKMGTLSTVTIEYFNDGGFVFNGNGNVYGEHWDGRAFNFRGNQTAWSGSPMPTLPGQSLANPKITIQLEKFQSNLFGWRMEGKQLSPLATQAEYVKLPNGSEFSIHTGPTPGQVSLNVMKGFIDFALPTPVPIHVVVGSSQGLVLGQIGSASRISLSNPSQSQIAATLPNNSVLWLGPDASVETEIKDRSLLGIAGLRGQVNLYDSSQRRLSSLGKSQRLIPTSLGFETSLTKIELFGGDKDQVGLRVNSRTVSENQIKASNSDPITLDGTQVSTLNGGKELRIQTGHKEAELTARGLFQWSLRIPSRTTLNVRYSESKAFVEIISDPNPTSAPHGTLIASSWDGTKTSIPPMSVARFDHFKNNSYFIVGSGLIDGVDAGGTNFNFKTERSYLMGGPLRRERTADGRDYQSRITPHKKATISFFPDSRPELRISTLSQRLSDSEVSRYSFPDGTLVEASLLSSNIAQLQVLKGLLLLQFPQSPFGEMELRSENSLIIKWDASKSLLELSQKAGTPPFSLSLADGSRTTLLDAGALAISPVAKSILEVKLNAGKATYWSKDLVTPRSLTDAPAELNVPENSLLGISTRVVQVQILDEIVDGAVALRIDNDTFSARNIAGLRSQQTTNGVEIATFQNGRGWTIRSIDRIVSVSAPRLNSWQTRINIGESATFTYKPALDWMEVSTAQSTSVDPYGVVTMNLPDGSKAFLGGFSSVLFESFSDGSLTLSGSGSARATSLQGKNLPLGTFSLPLRSLGTNAANRTSTEALATPLQVLRIRGNPMSIVNLDFSGQNSILTPGITRRIIHNNGTRLDLILEPATSSILIQNSKGTVMIELPELSSAKLILSTGQILRLAWESKSGLIQALNTQGDHPILVAFPDTSAAQLSEGSGILIKSEPNANFKLSAIQGSINFWHEASSKIMRLDQTPQHFTLKPSMWASSSQLEIIGGGERGIFGLKVKQDVSYTHALLLKNGGKVNTEGVELQSVEEGTKWIVRSVTRPALITHPDLEHGYIYLHLGETLTLSYNSVERVLRLATRKGSNPLIKELAELKLPDNSTLKLGVDSLARIEMFNDRTFWVNGRGVVNHLGAGGQATMLLESSLPYTGSYPPSASTNIVANYKDPLASLSHLHIKGLLTSQTRVVVNDLVADLDRSKTTRFTLTNGASLSLTHDSSKGIIRGTVHKGYFKIELESLADVGFVIGSEQTFELVQNLELQRTDFALLDAGFPAHVVLPEESVLHCLPGAVAQIVSDSNRMMSVRKLRGTIHVTEFGDDAPTPMTEVSRVFRLPQKTVSDSTFVHAIAASSKQIRFRFNGRNIYGFEEASRFRENSFSKDLNLPPYNKGKNGSCVPCPRTRR